MVNDSEHQLDPVSSFSDSGPLMHSAETGGLFRVAIKLMMACSTTNVDV